jgi:DNA-binding MarR family transcriptional regulator
MNELVEALQSFGMTRQEAIVYLYLYQNSQSTGYEIAKMTGISRSNVYNTLANLLEKGAVYSMEGTSTKYVTVSIREFCENHFLHLKKDMEFLKENIPVLEAKEEEGYITIQGYVNILDKLRSMIKSTKKRVYLSASYEVINLLEKELVDLCKEGKKVVLIANAGAESYEKNWDVLGCIIYKTKEANVQFRFVSDSSYVLTGELTGTQVDTCLYSCQTNFVKFFKEALRNEIQLIELKKRKEE